jgi:hypothetical protein
MRLAKKFIGRHAQNGVTVVFDALFMQLRKRLFQTTRSFQRFGSLTVFFAGGIHSSASVLQSHEFDWHFSPRRACLATLRLSAGKLSVKRDF